MAQKRLKRAYSVQNILDKKYTLLEWGEPWVEAFGNPENKGVWFIWGQSASGKNALIFQMIKEFSRFDRIIMKDMEESTAHTVRLAFETFNMIKVSKKLIWAPDETMEEFDERLSAHKAPRVAIINSLQYTGWTWADYLAFIKKHEEKLIVITSQADGKKPDGRLAKRIMYDASQKIFVEGFRAYSKGRYIGPKGYLEIWKEGAAHYHGTEE
ncbi:hypothetical protein [Roseivirga sp. UBA838]|uniref:hypothetical protein n=1 Tax=Roseivirga sp. UBA838 TaxID=1947393 RepID=UPI00257FD95D|nr:hypothetical protein [Roseivirga sp. UBA838]|tara:strand:+ start:10681 stop:11316 length:636 start_codon:yes stop_codon:yes gene_type:complete